MCLQILWSQDSVLGLHRIIRFIGYEPADLTVHPPPPNYRGWVHFFRIGLVV